MDSKIALGKMVGLEEGRTKVLVLLAGRDDWCLRVRARSWKVCVEM